MPTCPDCGTILTEYDVVNELYLNSTPLEEIAKIFSKKTPECCRNNYLMKNIFKTSYGSGGSEANYVTNLFEMTDNINKVVLKEKEDES